MKVALSPLRGFCTALMEKSGLSQEEAALFADSLLAADMRGIGSHGVTRLRTYSGRVRSGVVKAGVRPEILRDSPGLLLVDGCNGVGTTVARSVIDLLIARAKENGSCSAAVRGGNHFGIAAYHTLYAAKQGMIAVAMSNAPASVVPTGGSRPMLGTNPLSVAVPAGRHEALVLDMATSTVAQGKVILAQKEGRPIPAGWAVDACGAPTTDPDAALNGAMLPFGGPKGYAIALIIELLCAPLAGALDSTEIHSFWKDFEHPQNLGFFFSVLRVETIMPLEVFRARVDALLDRMKATPTAPGVSEVLIPGELERRQAEQAQREGVELGNAVIEDLRALGEEYGIAWPC